MDNLDFIKSLGCEQVKLNIQHVEKDIFTRYLREILIEHREVLTRLAKK